VWCLPIPLLTYAKSSISAACISRREILDCIYIRVKRNHNFRETSRPQISGNRAFSSKLTCNVDRERERLSNWPGCCLILFLELPRGQVLKECVVDGASSLELRKPPQLPRLTQKNNETQRLMVRRKLCAHRAGRDGRRGTD
jgi:hypothetical protein